MEEKAPQGIFEKEGISILIFPSLTGIRQKSGYKPGC